MTNLETNLKLIAPNGKAMILAYDQGFEHGPRDFSENPRSANFEYILQIAKEGGFTGLVAHMGLAEKYKREICDSGIPLIVKLNGKSELPSLKEDPYSPQLYSVEDASAVWAKAVGYTVYSGSKYEAQMNKEFAQIIRTAHTKGMLAIGWMYPRGEGLKEKGLSDKDESVVAYGARIGLELGADIVKVKYTGSVESFNWVVRCAYPTKVVMSGGPKTTDEEFLADVRDVLSAGACGIAVGRNVWQNKYPLEISKKLRETIFNK